MSEEKQSKNDQTPQTPQPEAQEIDYRDHFLRLQAEFANYKRRTDEERPQLFAHAKAEVFKDMLEVIDDFELALKTKTDSEQFTKGMEMIFAKFITKTEEFGLERIKTVGEQFNPVLHEALLAEDSDKPEQEILEELQAGYKLGDKVIRTAKVKVAR